MNFQLKLRLDSGSAHIKLYQEVRWVEWGL